MMRRRTKRQPKPERPKYIYWIEVGGKPVPADWETWARRDSDGDLTLVDEVGMWHIVTVFIGFALSTDSVPLLYSTGRYRDGLWPRFAEMKYYATRKEAVAGHKEMVNRFLRERTEQ